MNTSFEQITDKKTLTELLDNEKGIVTKLRGSANTLALFRSLGIILDAPVKLVKVEKSDPYDNDVHFKIGGNPVSLKKELAENIRVSVARIRPTLDVDRIIEKYRIAALPLAR